VAPRGSVPPGRREEKEEIGRKTNLKMDFYTEDAESTEFAEKKEKAAG
jgi:hypothetical protein